MHVVKEGIHASHQLPKIGRVFSISDACQALKGYGGGIFCLQICTRTRTQTRGDGVCSVQKDAACQAFKGHGEGIFRQKTIRKSLSPNTSAQSLLLNLEHKRCLCM
jgi:hypothetical protein